MRSAAPIHRAVLVLAALLIVSAGPGPASLRPSAWWLARLPDGVEKRKFILDCTGCHQFNETRVFAGDSLRSRARWEQDVARMLRYAGASSAFPVIAADRDSKATAAWLTAHLGRATLPSGTAPDDPPAPGSAPTGTEVREYDLPVAADLPHDVAVDTNGRVLITGMFSHVIMILDPASGTVEQVPIPVPNANPRAIELDRAGNWWVLLGRPMRVARYEPQAARWRTWPIGLYPHSVAVSPDARAVWFNGHFTRDPELIGRLDVASGRVDSFPVPRHPVLAGSGGPVPYEQRLAPDGTVWMSELQGNRIVRLDPVTRAVRTYTMPEPWSGPRRFDVDRNGVLWIPAYASGRLVRFDPRTERFTEHTLPVSDALPYVARVDPRDGRVWIGTAAADRVFRFDPATTRFESFALPTRGATVRHLVVDPRNGDVWLAYGASPALHPARVARLRVPTPRSSGQ